MRKSLMRLFLLGGGLVMPLLGLLVFSYTIPVAADPDDPSIPLVNELVIDNIEDDTHEFIEVWGDSNTDYASYTVLVIEGDVSSNAQGRIDRVYPVGTTNENGYWITGFLTGQLENQTLTILLVQDFDGQVGDDIDVDDDGLIDSEPPWTAVVDDVGVHDGDVNDFVYSTVSLTETYDGNSGYGASRIPDHVDSDSSADWVRNDEDGEGLPGFLGTPEIDEALNTPGAENRLPMAEALVINEIDYDQPGADTAEFIEIKNNSTITVNLYTYQIELVREDGSDYGSITMPSMHLAAGDYFVACSLDDDGTVLNCDHEFSSSIQNGVNAVALWFGDDVSPVDTVSYEGDAVSPYTEVSGVTPGDDSAGLDGISRKMDGVDTDNNSEDFEQRCLTPGFANTTATTDCEALLEPSLAAALTAVPDSVVEPGAAVTFTFSLTNTGPVSLTVTILTENEMGSLDGAGSCALPVILEMDDVYVCQYDDDVNGSAGQQVTRSVTAVAEDKNGVEVQAMADDTITIREEDDPDPDPEDDAIYLPVIMKPFTYGEPNDECESAFSLELDSPNAFYAEDIHDWYTFDLSSSTAVQIELTDFAPAAGQMLVYSGNCNGLVAEAHDGALSIDNVLDLGTLASGQYFVWLINDGALNATDLYTLTILTP